jgi:hypothetical protein
MQTASTLCSRCELCCPQSTYPSPPKRPETRRLSSSGHGWAAAPLTRTCSSRSTLGFPYCTQMFEGIRLRVCIRNWTMRILASAYNNPHMHDDCAYCVYMSLSAGTAHASEENIIIRGGVPSCRLNPSYMRIKSSN